MKVGMMVESNLAEALARLPEGMSFSVQRNTLMAGAEPIRAEAALRAPRDERAGPPHLADHIVIDALTEAEAARSVEFVTEEAIVQVGPSVRHFYGYFSEFGTSHEPARPWFRPAFDTRKDASLRIVLAQLWSALERQAKKVARLQRKVFGQHASRAASARARSSGVGL